MSGQVVNDSNTGISGVNISVITGTSCLSWSGSTTTSPFGYYSMLIPEDCVNYVFPSKKNYSITPTSRTIQLGGPFDNINFVANPV